MFMLSLNHEHLSMFMLSLNHEHPFMFMLSLNHEHLSMFMLLLIFVIVCGILGQIYVCLLFVSILPLEINLSKEEGWDTINQFNTVTFLCLS